MPCAPVLTRSQVIGHHQVIENAIIVESEHPKAGRLRQARPAARFSETPTGLDRAAPGLGQHTAEALAEAGYSVAEIAGLAAEGDIPDREDGAP